MKKIIIFIGPPGSGKGTQAKLLAKKYNYGHISTGDLLRALLAQGTADEKEHQALSEMKAGKLVPDWLIYKLAFQAIEEFFANGQGVILDGAIRNVEQAKEYQKFFAQKGLEKEVEAVEVELPDEESYNRITKRRICSKCGEIIPWLPATKNIKVCPKCGGELIARQDDSEDVIRKRILEQGNTALAPIAAFYKKLGLLKTTDGMKDIKQVTEDLENLLNK